MRKLLDPNFTALASPPVYDSPSLSPAPSPYSFPSPSPSPSPLLDRDISESNYHDLFYLFPSIPIADSASEVATISIISIVFLISFLSVAFILHLRCKSRCSQHLQNFSTAWSVRLLLVAFVSFWATNEVLRLPFFRERYIYPFLPPLTLTQEANLCKIYVVFSLGFYEPAILVTLLFLVNISIKRKNPSNTSAITTVGIMCLPLLFLQTFFVFLSPLEAHLPSVVYRSSVLSKDIYGNKTVTCTYPLSSTIVFAAFGLAYSLGFLMSCWRVLSMVINKCIRTRINVLVLAVMVALPLQSLSLALSSFWSPENAAFSGVVMTVFLSVVLCAVVGQWILVIKPTADALATEADYSQCNPRVQLQAKDIDNDGSNQGSEDRKQ